MYRIIILYEQLRKYSALSDTHEKTFIFRKIRYRNKHYLNSVDHMKS